MKNNQKIPVSILADREVFDYLKEKGDDRKTRTEAYCDLLDKSLAGFVSPFLRKKAYVLQPNQCHLTVSDLASEWHWHRATVRSFLSAMEAFGLLTRIQLPKSVVITMTVQSGQAAQPRNAQEQPDFAGQLREVLSDWVIGKTTAAETGVICGQLVSLAKTEIADRDTGLCSDTHSNTTSAHSGTLVTEHRETALCCIAHAALQKILHKSRFDDSSPLVDFFRFDLGEEWAAFIESAKDLAGLILDTEASVTDFDMDEDQERLKSLSLLIWVLSASFSKSTFCVPNASSCIRSREPPKMKFTTVRYFGSASPSLGSLIPRLSNMSAIRSGMLRLVSMGRTLPPGAISKFRCLRVGS